jgi:hypothetical protein
MLNKIFGSTNFTLQSLMLLLTALALFIGFPTDLLDEVKEWIVAAVFTVGGFWGSIREWLKKGVKFTYSGNALAYVFAFIGGLVPWIASYDLAPAIDQLLQGVLSGNLNAILPAAFMLINILIRITQDKPWQADPTLKN